MMMVDVGFYVLALGIIGTSFLFLFLKDPIHNLLSFFLLTVQVAAIMILLEAVLVALLFLLFYTTLVIGFLVFYMKTQNHKAHSTPSLSLWYKGLIFLILSLLGGHVIFSLIYKAQNLLTKPVSVLETISASPRVLGEIIYHDYGIFLIYLTILFFAAFVGIILILGPKKIKNKQTSIEKVQRDLGSIHLKEMRGPRSEEGSKEI